MSTCAQPAIVGAMSLERTIVVVLGLTFVALTLAAGMTNQTHAPTADTVGTSHTWVQVGSAIVRAEVANTPALWTRGLSGHAGLGENEGMLFVFNEEAGHGIWMKDMRFAIDIIWATQDGTVVTIKENATPESYPEAFYPAEPALYVLEVPAGFAGRAGVAVGDKIVVQ